MTLTIDPERLACGTPVELLLAHLAGDPDAVTAAHAGTCPHCRTAAAELAPGLGVLQREVAAPTPAVPAGVERSVLRRIRMGLAASEEVPLPAAGRGRTTARAGVIAEVARLAADAVPGVSRVSVDVAGDLALSVSLAVRYGQPIPALAAEVRDAVAGELRTRLGLRVGSIDVEVADLA